MLAYMGCRSEQPERRCLRKHSRWINSINSINPPIKSAIYMLFQRGNLHSFILGYITFVVLYDFNTANYVPDWSWLRHFYSYSS